MLGIQVKLKIYGLKSEGREEMMTPIDEIYICGIPYCYHRQEIEKMVMIRLCLYYPPNK